jgi:acetyltransferase
MFFPGSVAVFGVSDAPTNLARVIVENMDCFRFPGTVYLVGGKAGSLDGRSIYADVSELPEVPDVAIFLVPARSLAAAVEACGKKGVRHIVIETGGFSEFGDDRKYLEAEVLSIAGKWGMEIIGPNCVGIINVENGLVMPFYPVYPNEIRQGSISIISQSGGIIYDLMMLCHMENIGFRKLISIGNKLMLDENAFLEYLAADAGTAMIGLYLEDIRDGRRFMDLAAAADKPIILLKANRSPEGGEIARLHTAALAGDDRIADEAMKQVGVHRVFGLKEMVDCFKAFSLPLPKGPRLAVMARSGGLAVLAADSANRYGFTLASFSDRLAGMLTEKTRSGVIKRGNPIDLGDVFDIDLYLEITEMALREEGADGVLIAHSYAPGDDALLTRKFIRHCAALTGTYGKPVMFCTSGHKVDWFDIRNVADLPVLSRADDALAALSISLAHYRNRAVKRGQRPRYVLSGGRAAIKPRLSPGLTPVQEVFELLKAYGIAVADYRIVEGLADCLESARAMGYPVVLKSALPGMLHKTEEGAVVLDIRDEAALKNAFDSIKAGPFFLQKMAPPGCEVILGGRTDQEFGPVVLCGLGGIFAEVYDDVAIRVAPVDEETAGAMTDEIKGARILKGFRGKGGYDVGYLVASIVNISRLLLEHPEIRTLDINPLIVMNEKGGGFVVDAKTVCD